MYMYYFKPTYWYNTALCFPMGMWFSYFKTKIEELLYNNDKLWILSVVLCTLLLLITYKAKSNIWIYDILFALLIVIITMRLSIQNKILYWLGKNLFGLYILQRIPMIILKHLNVHLSQPYIYVSLCFVLMIIIGGTFNFFTKNINLKKVD